ncbi:MAG: c-type cytochrome [Hydrogenimonas sp.]|nr:c-type cytochrome [Hydrogenimonas sp.]
MKVRYLLVSLSAGFVFAAGEPLKSGEKIYFSMGCYGCHGVYGEGVNTFPKLAGKSKNYLIKRLEELKSGIGHTSSKEMMVPYAKALSREQIEAVSTFLADSIEGENMEVPEDILGGNI